jgi:HEAT repeat protein
MITWGVQAEVYIVGDDDLATTFEGVGRGEAPFVRAALPNLDEAFKEVLKGAAVTALLDMQIRYENVSEALAVKGLNSRHPEEVWAGLRRLGELGATGSTEAIIDALADGSKLTQVIAGGVLVRLQDPSAIAQLLTIATEMTDPANVVFVADVINQLGGEAGKAAVRKLTQSHPNEDARAALSRGLPSDQP